MRFAATTRWSKRFTTTRWWERLTSLPGRAPLSDQERFVARWQEIQAGFVDEPRRAVQDADALVVDMMDRLARMLASEREQLELPGEKGGLDRGPPPGAAALPLLVRAAARRPAPGGPHSIQRPTRSVMRRPARISASAATAEAGGYGGCAVAG